jgi:hypothetical protein
LADQHVFNADGVESHYRLRGDWTTGVSNMRKLLLAGAAGAALFTTGLIAPTSANAMPLAPLASSPGLVDNVAYWCRPIWRCGAYGCGWTRACGWRPGPYLYGGYGFARPYWGYRWGYRPWAYGGGYHRYW